MPLLIEVLNWFVGEVIERTTEFTRNKTNTKDIS